MTHKFIVNTENVNTYGYRILTAGIDYEQYMRNPVVLYMHNRSTYNAKGTEVIGRCVKLYVENNELIAEIEFDTDDDFAKTIAGKVERGYLRMVSLHADVIEQSSDTELILPGQKFETITKCKLVEISIVDIGGNDDALKLSNGNGQPFELKLLNQKTENNMSDFKSVALALGKSIDSNETTVLQAVNDLKLSKDKAETERDEWKEKFVSLQKSEATTLVDKAVSLGLIPEDLKDAQIVAFEADFDGQKTKLSKLIEDKEGENNKNGIQNSISAAVSLSKDTKTQVQANEKESFDYLRQHNPVELARIQKEDPTKYAQLGKDFASGVRYKGGK
ncbi:HK97 family phage prohead protease [Chryseobacterium daeguense]|uniref:HK97 family phage prohead protease n=1 Tax=Chryseobacterium daeguense TaxID=412438 RepID=UPI0004848037|nr:HK97 family phage prohead protease [Chryseobacterium daeguense]